MQLTKKTLLIKKNYMENASKEKFMRRINSQVILSDFFLEFFF